MSNDDSVPAETILAQNAEVIRTLGKRVIADVIEIGRRLSESKKLGGHGNWLSWLETEFGWDERTARRYISVHELAGKSDNLSDLEIGVSSLYLLAAPSTPEEVRQAVIERAAHGERMSVKDVKKLIGEVSNKLEETATQLVKARETEIRAEYVAARGSWLRKPPPERVADQTYLQFLRTKCHPVTDAVRLMTAEEFMGLVGSIKAHGQIDPIILIEYGGENVILDGRCREIACVIAGVEPKYQKIEVDDPREYFASVNIERASYTRDQCLMAEARLTKPGVGEEVYDPDLPPPPLVAARFVLARCELLAGAVINGVMSLREAYEQAVDDAWLAQHRSVSPEWLRSNFVSKDIRD